MECYCCCNRKIVLLGRTIPTAKSLMGISETNRNLPWEEVRGSVEDLIAGLGGLVSATEAKHQKITPVSSIKRHAFVEKTTLLYFKAVMNTICGKPYTRIHTNCELPIVRRSFSHFTFHIISINILLEDQNKAYWIAL